MMDNPVMELVVVRFHAVATDPASEEAWAHAREALKVTGTSEPELTAAVEARDASAVQSLLRDWDAGRRPLPVHDRELLQRALKAFRKSLKVTRLDAESSIAGGPMSAGRHSSILGIRPPDRYPRMVWDELARQGRLIAGRHGLYELPPE
jgi:hypothetical protein